MCFLGKKVSAEPCKGNYYDTSCGSEDKDMIVIITTEILL